MGIVEYAEKYFNIKLTDAQKKLLEYVEEHPDAQIYYRKGGRGCCKKREMDILNFITSSYTIITSYKDFIKWDEVINRYWENMEGDK